VTAGPKSWSLRPDGLTAGTGWGSWRGAATLEQAPSPPAKVSRGVALHVSSPSEVRGEATEKRGSGTFRGLKNQVISTTTISALYSTAGWPFSAFGVLQKNSFTIVGWGSIDPSSTP